MTRLIALIAALAISSGAFAQTLGVRRVAHWNGTVYATSQKVAIQDVWRKQNREVQILNYGKLGGGSGILYVGLISKNADGAVNYDTLWAASGWGRAVKIPPPPTTGDFVTYGISSCWADSVYLKSTDSVTVSIIVQ